MSMSYTCVSLTRADKDNSFGLCQYNKLKSKLLNKITQGGIIAKGNRPEFKHVCQRINISLAVTPSELQVKLYKQIMPSFYTDKVVYKLNFSLKNSVFNLIYFVVFRYFSVCLFIYFHIFLSFSNPLSII